LVIVKPDGVERGLAGEIIARLEKRGLRLCALKLQHLPPSLVEEHYAQHRGRAFFPAVVSFLSSGPVVLMVWEGPGAIAAIRQTMGATDPAQALPGTIRGDLGISIAFNLVHGSDSAEAAAREIGLFFRPEEIVAYRRAGDRWIAPE
jgi:nucleoside-diphosphate kinase